MKFPKFPKLTPRQPKRKINATTAASRRAAPPVEDYYDEPQTKFSSAMIVVLVLHVVAVGGIYAFNSIKANRKGLEPAPQVSVPGASVVPPPTSLGAPANVAGASALVASQTPERATAPVLSTATSSVTGARVHHVKTGDTLPKLALAYGVSSAEIEEANGPKSLAVLHQGQILNIPKPKATPAPVVRKVLEEAPKVAAAGKAGTKTYVVAKGDVPEAIARKLGVSYRELLKVNKIEDPKKLQIGQTLIVPPALPAGSPGAVTPAAPKRN